MGRAKALANVRMDVAETAAETVLHETAAVDADLARAI